MPQEHSADSAHSALSAKPAHSARSQSADESAAHRWLLVPMLPHHAESICTWRYEPPYDIFNWPAWDVMVREGDEFGDPAIREQQYAAALLQPRPGAPAELAGFAQFFPIAGVSRLGLGLRPDLCSRGLGPSLVAAIVGEARRLAPRDAIDLEVLSWNQRAIRAYERCGFVIADTYTRQTPTGPAEFHCMEYIGSGQ